MKKQEKLNSSHIIDTFYSLILLISFFILLFHFISFILEVSRKGDHGDRFWVGLIDGFWKISI